MTKPTQNSPECDFIVWMDLEMTGLDPEEERILEIATIITDSDLKIIAEGPHLIIHQSDTLLASMDGWCTEHHGASGLTERVRKSTLSERDAELQTLEFIRAHCPERTCPLAGNSVHQDKRFLARYMPEIEAYLHYRIIDVSTVKEIGRRWLPTAYEARPSKKGSHRALDDIRESIAELAYYRDAFFRAEPASGSAPTR